MNSTKLTDLLSQLETMEQLQTVLQLSATVKDLNIQVNKNFIAPLVALARRNSKRQTSSKPRQIVVVVPNSKNAQDLCAYLKHLGQDTCYLPAWETLPHEKLSPRIETMAQRNQIFSSLLKAKKESSVEDIKILVTTARSFVQPVLMDSLTNTQSLKVEVGTQIDYDLFKQKLIDLGYNPTDMVSNRGDFAVRGAIVDLFIPTHQHPVRIEFFGDDIDDIRYFSVADQRTIEKYTGQLEIYPCRELIITDKIKVLASSYKDTMPQIAHMLERIENGIYAPGIEALANLFVNKIGDLTTLLDEEAIIILHDIQGIKRINEDLKNTSLEFMQANFSSSQDLEDTPINVDNTTFFDIDHLLHTPTKTSKWYISELDTDAQADEHLHIDVKPAPQYQGNYSALAKDLTKLIRQGSRILISTVGSGNVKRLQQVLEENDVPVNTADEHLVENVVNIAEATTTAGYSIGDLHFISHADISGKISRYASNANKRIHKRKNAVDPLSLRKGDYIVHDYHGIGRFLKLMTRELAGSKKQGLLSKEKTRPAVTKEYLVIEYASSRRGLPPDQLLVPTDNLDRISKYTGAADPTLNKLGGSDWAKTKQKARKAIREITGELVRLYAKRANTKGYAFSEDTTWQNELESSFEYVETADQLTVIDEIKRDMEKPVPMDRLLCGDVGYGKTEVAVRAAFKAVQDGKQVAVLAPTTILAQQHYETFSSRYISFPVKVACLSRFTTTKEAERIRQELAEGKIDVIIGTHRLLTGKVTFKDLGLVIIDEEQRFGVEHKEVLKQFRNNVDVLAMSATPIPRTLEMAVTGIREMSTLSTPPEERHPVLTYVGPYSDRQVTAAIKREILRDGQVFYVHNKVEDIDKVAHKIAELVPQAKVAVAHGRMNESQLEKVIVDFWNREFDVLVCTTIIETGLDIANANTLIIDKAENFGLSQLHQLRGRVGRSSERAYAYFLYSENKTLSETAQERLETIANNSDLGAGMQVAMKDLEIRGAGNLLGGQQSGHIEGVGFDLYMRMIAEAISAFKGEVVQEREFRIDLPVDSHIPKDYISNESMRLETYTKISKAKDTKQLQAIAEELQDRFGAIPHSVELIFEVTKLKLKAMSCGIEEIVTQGKNIRFAPVILPESKVLRLGRLYPSAVIKAGIRAVLIPLPTGNRIGESQTYTNEKIIEWVNTVLDQIFISDHKTQ